jgi:TrmH family RNA methyltransferase
VRERGIPVQEVTSAEFASASGTETPQGILAIAEVPQCDLTTLQLTEPFRLLVLDGVQDPGNVGTIVRTAAALGAAAIVSLPGTVDLWNAKVVRSSMGALFHHPTLACTWEELTAFRFERQFSLWGADAAGESLFRLVQGGDAIPARLALAVGNEGAGLSARTRESADKLVSVEIAPAVESLNVAVATGILLYELRLNDRNKS